MKSVLRYTEDVEEGKGRGEVACEGARPVMNVSALLCWRTSCYIGLRSYTVWLACLTLILPLKINLQVRICDKYLSIHSTDVFSSYDRCYRLIRGSFHDKSTSLQFCIIEKLLMQKLLDKCSLKDV